MDEVVRGIVSGAIAGLVVSAFLGLFAVSVKRWRRWDQIRHIRQVIMYGREEIVAVPEDEAGLIPSQPIRVSSDDARNAIFIGMRRGLDLILEGRASEIRFDEKMGIKRIWVTDDLIRSRKPPVNRSKEILDHFFERLAGVTWLKLPR